MSGFDWIIVAIFVLSIIVGVMRGFIREALSLTSWILAFWLALTFCGQAGDYIGQFISIPAEAFRVSVGFAAVFIITLFVFSIVSFIISKLLVNKAVKGTDRFLGLLFGGVRALGIVVIVMIFARGLGMDNSNWWKNSNFLGHFVPAADYFEQMLPDSFRSTEEKVDLPADETSVSEPNSDIDTPGRQEN